MKLPFKHFLQFLIIIMLLSASGLGVITQDNDSQLSDIPDNIVEKIKNLEDIYYEMN